MVVLQTSNTHAKEPPMNHDTTPCALPALTADFLRSASCLVDNLFADLWKQVGISALLSRYGFRKRSGVPVDQVMYCLMMWVWLKSDSIGMFARESLKTFCNASKDVLYEAMNREDWNWRSLHAGIAQKAARALNSAACGTALILDDSIKERHGKKMPGISSHFDHTTGRKVMGQQVLTLGLSCFEGFVPLDNEIFISQSKARGLDSAFADGRSIVGKRYSTAKNQTKPQMARAMLSRALRAGFKAEYLIADAWFGTKQMIGVAQDALLVPIFRMKKNLMKYRYTPVSAAQQCEPVELDVCALYQCAVRKQWDKMPGQPYESKVLDVDLNLNESTDKKQRWVKVRLLFVRGLVQPGAAQPGKHDWAVFLTTDCHLAPQKIVELYSLRWAIEVYFKEVKQHLGLLTEQARHYACYVASIHLASIRFCLLVIAKQQHQSTGIGLPQMRKQISTNITNIDFASRLWLVFRALISGALDELKMVLGDAYDLVMSTIDQHVNRFFVQALQLDPFQLRLEAK